ncbi:hypothetical protein [Actinoplanes sp. RD1]|uniref:hypothetical protein n=1 Tax=Actinoplanes sp. RD1 TaxID=3064538 RepID=UPI0027428DDD|nr:hypothetical protein [Actinoplanes sp. RD1]
MSLTLDEARARAAMLADVSYDLALDVTSPESFRSRVTVRFRTTGAAAVRVLRGRRANGIFGLGRRTGSSGGWSSALTERACLPGQGG